MFAEISYTRKAFKGPSDISYLANPVSDFCRTGCGQAMVENADTGGIIKAKWIVSGMDGDVEHRSLGGREIVRSHRLGHSSGHLANDRSRQPLKVAFLVRKDLPSLKESSYVLELAAFYSLWGVILYHLPLPTPGTIGSTAWNGV